MVGLGTVAVAGALIGLAALSSRPAYAQGATGFVTSPKNTVMLVFTHEYDYNPQWLEGFAKAMRKEWGVNVMYVQVDPPHRMENGMDYLIWKKQLGIEDFQTLFITDVTPTLYNQSEYGAYVYPDQKVGYYNNAYVSDSYRLCHEVLHMFIYEQTGGDITKWSIRLHDHTNTAPADKVERDEYVNGVLYNYYLVPRFSLT